MPSQEFGRRDAVPEKRLVHKRAGGLTSTVIQQMIDTGVGGSLDRDAIQDVGDTAYPYTIPGGLSHVLVVTIFGGDAGSAKVLTLPAATENDGQRVIYRAVGTFGAGVSVSFAAPGGETLTEATDITAAPATRVFYSFGDAWYQVLAEDPPAVADPTYPSARVVCTQNMDLSGTETEDGVSLSVGDIALCMNQTTASQNGLQMVSLTAWTRPDGWQPQPGDVIHIREGTLFKNTRWQLENDAAPTVGTDAQTWRRSDQRLVTIHGSDSNEVVKNNLGRLRFSFPNLTANRILTLPVATDGQEVLVQIEANVGATRQVSFTVASGLINNNAAIVGPWASGLFVARGGNWNKMNI